MKYILYTGICIVCGLLIKKVVGNIKYDINDKYILDSLKRYE